MTEVSAAPIDVVYLGRRQTTKGQNAHSFMAVSTLEKLLSAKSDFDERFPDEVTARVERAANLFTVKGSGPNSIGAVYEAVGVMDGDSVVRMYPDKLRFKSRESSMISSAMIAAWRTMDRAVHEAATIKSAEKKFDADPSLAQAVKIIRSRYARIPAGYRRGFQFWLLDEIAKKDGK